MKKYAFVTGADRGLGLEISKQLLKNNFYVFAGKFLTKWNLLEELKKKYPDDMSIISIDVSSDTSVKKAAKEISMKAEYIDVLVNNAAISGKYMGTIFDELDFEDMLKTFNINSLGSLRVTNAMVTLIMNSFHKLIVNISSEAGSIGTCWRYEGFGYCMSKAAMNMSSSIIHNSLHRQYNGQVMNFNPGGMPSHFGSTSADDEIKAPIDEKGFTNAKKSAKGIVSLILDQERFKSDHPVFLSYGGNNIPW